MNNLIEYKDGATFLGSSTGWEEKVSMGRGWAYGLEFTGTKIDRKNHRMDRLYLVKIGNACSTVRERK